MQLHSVMFFPTSTEGSVHAAEGLGSLLAFRLGNGSLVFCRLVLGTQTKQHPHSKGLMYSGSVRESLRLLISAAFATELDRTERLPLALAAPQVHHKAMPFALKHPFQTYKNPLNQKKV